MLFWNVLATNTFTGDVGGVKNIGTFAFPKVPTSAYPVGTPDSGYNANWSLMNYSKHCRAAWNYISFTLSQQAQAIMWRVGRTLPVNNTVQVKGSNQVEGGHPQARGQHERPHGHRRDDVGAGGGAAGPAPAVPDQRPDLAAGHGPADAGAA